MDNLENPQCFWGETYDMVERYIDDIFFIWENGEESLEKILKKVFIQQ